MEHIFKCQKCGTYTMKETCKCGSQAITTRPVRYAHDNIGKYRREARREELKNKGLL
ncbi:ribosome biogenesis protein [Candidatus Woesearchaeota archaeon]|nr:ribosome biogenesis protein [Candidatus Woesearchaeota archaeon]